MSSSKLDVLSRYTTGVANSSDRKKKRKEKQTLTIRDDDDMDLRKRRKTKKIDEMAIERGDIQIVTEAELQVAEKRLGKEIKTSSVFFTILI